MKKELTSGELIHRFRRKDEWGPGEWEKDFQRIIEAVERESVEKAREDERETIEPLWLGALAARGLASVAMEVAEEVRDMRKRLTRPTEG